MSDYTPASVVEAKKLVGKTATLLVRENAGELRVEVQILQVREMFGRVDCLIRGTAGPGEAWVSVDRLRVAR